MRHVAARTIAKAAVAATVVGGVVAVAAPPAQAEDFRYAKCVVAREMRTFPSSTSDNAYSTTITFNTTVWASQSDHGRYHVVWRSPGLHGQDYVAWISDSPAYTDAGACTGTPI